MASGDCARYACGRSGEMCEMQSPEVMASGDCARYACGRSGEMCEMRSPEVMASGDCARYACGPVGCLLVSVRCLCGSSEGSVSEYYSHPTRLREMCNSRSANERQIAVLQLQTRSDRDFHIS